MSRVSWAVSVGTLLQTHTNYGFSLHATPERVETQLKVMLRQSGNVPSFTL
jgi:hypothetical protein